MIRILPEAEAEIADAVRWYGHKRTGLGRVFKAEFRKALDRIVQRPEVFPRDPAYVGPRDLRRCQFRRFQYHVVFVRNDDHVPIVAVSHDHQRPAYWSGRLHSSG